jgi:hypothetical protein
MRQSGVMLSEKNCMKLGEPGFDPSVYFKAVPTTAGRISIAARERRGDRRCRSSA